MLLRPHMIDQTLGHFRITAKLGEGGMGVVYRAEDSKLGRGVAIKVLPEAFTADSERLARFEREARVLASLNHPNIAGIHEVGVAESSDLSDVRSGTIHYLVMELADGDELANRIARGPLPLEAALPIALQIAQAIEAAHGQGIIHRDLKPANVKVTEKGVVKVLDFGLAKAWDTETTSGSGPMMTHSPTLTAQMTQAGTLLGTAAYMSPEQARGQPVDKRSDIWAFGCLLVEMLTGSETFAGETVTDVFASIVTRDPEWEKLPPRTPASIRRMLGRCLEKDPDRRLHDIADARIEIEEVLRAGLPEKAEDLLPAGSSRAVRWWQGLTAAATLVAITFGILFWQSATRRAPVVRATMPAPEGTSFDLDMSSPGLVAVSPDGLSLAFSATDEEGITRLWVRELDDLEARILAGTRDAAYPFWSPDGRYLAFFDGRKLKKIEIAGGPPITLCNASNGKGGSWNEDQVIVFAPSHASALFRVSASGGEAKAVSELDGERFNSHRFPQFLPDGDRFLFLARVGVTGSGNSRIMVGSLAERSTREIMPTISNAIFAQGHLFFVVERTLMARAFDSDRLAIEGDLFPVAENILFSAGAARGMFSVSEGGLLAYHAGASFSGSTLQLYARDGAVVEPLDAPDAYLEIRLSPDGATLATSIADESGNQDLWLLDLERGTRDRFTFHEASEYAQAWSPDGERLVFSSDRGQGTDLWVKEFRGAGEEELLFEDDRDKYPSGWSPDGKYVLYSSPGAETSWDAFALAVDEDEAQPIALQPSAFAEAYPQVSQDGRWLLYTSGASGRSEIFVTSFPTGGRKWQISIDGGTQPLWDRSGKAVYWIAGPTLLSADVDGSGEVFRVGAISRLIEGLKVSFLGPYQYDVMPDGQRLLVNQMSEVSSPPMTLVVGFPAELRRDR